MYGDTDEEQLRCDMIADCFRDVGEIMHQLTQDLSQEKKVCSVHCIYQKNTKKKKIKLRLLFSFNKGRKTERPSRKAWLHGKTCQRKWTICQWQGKLKFYMLYSTLYNFISDNMGRSGLGTHTELLWALASQRFRRRKIPEAGQKSNQSWSERKNRWVAKKSTEDRHELLTNSCTNLTKTPGFKYGTGYIVFVLALYIVHNVHVHVLSYTYKLFYLHVYI